MSWATVTVRHPTTAADSAADRTPQLSQLPDVTVGEVAAFIALMRCGTFTAAARHLHLSQPGLSARITRLERALGAPLTDRSTRQLTLTPTGVRFAPLAETMVRLMATATAQTATVRGRGAAAPSARITETQP